MSELTIQEKIGEFLNTHRELAGNSPERILSVMVECGAISPAEYEQAKKTSVFGQGFKPDNTIGVTVERTSPQPAAQAENTERTQKLQEAQCKEIVIKIIDNNITEANQIFNAQYLGDISRAYDEKWKGEGDKLATSNVKKVLDFQHAGEVQMVQAKNGTLTRRAYYEENKQRLKDMILMRLNVLETPSGVKLFDDLRGKYSQKQMQDIINSYIERICSNIEMDKLKDLQKQFVTFSTAEEVTALCNFVESAKTYNENYRDTTMMLGEGRPTKLKGPDKGLIPSYWDSAEPITFEEVYKLERGCEYSQYAVERYVQAKAEMETVVKAFNKKQQFVDFAQNLRDENLTSAEKSQQILEGFEAFYMLSDDGGLSRLQKIIDKSNLPVLLDENGINLSAFTTEEAKTRALNSLLKIAAQEKEKDFETFLGGKSFEDYQKSFEDAGNAILGEDNAKMLADAMKNDNMTVIQRWTGNVSTGGLIAIGTGVVLMIVGGVLCLTPAAPAGAATAAAGGKAALGATLLAWGGNAVTVGNGIALTGMVSNNALGFYDYSTKDIKTAEELNELTNGLIMDAGGFVIGMGAGKLGMKAFRNLIDAKLAAVLGKEFSSATNKAQALKTVFSNPEYLKSFMVAGGSKLSTDFIISYAGDLAMMGILDTKDDWRSLLQANLTGILVGVGSDIKDWGSTAGAKNATRGTQSATDGISTQSRNAQTEPAQPSPPPLFMKMAA